MKKPKNNPSGSHLPAFLKQLMASRLFLQNFLFIMGIMTLMFLSFALFIYRQSANILKREFTASSQYRLEVTSQAIDNHLMDMRYIAATLATSKMVQAFFAYPDPGLIYDEFYGRVQENLKAYVNGYSSIDSIYLYSGASGSVLTSNERTSIAYHSDRNWMEHLSRESGDFSFFFRSKNNAYPYLLCIMKQQQVNGHDAVIVINLNLGNLSHLTEVSSNPYQEIFLVSDDGNILFRHHQRALMESLETVPELSAFSGSKDTFSTLIDDGADPFTYTQVHSADYPWSYITITHLQEYTSMLSSSRALLSALLFALFCGILLIAFLFSMRSVKPIRNLLALLRNPQDTLSRSLYNDREICYIADQITSYIQQNQMLSDELSARLNLLNETRLLALQSQINPHFLFNTLNTIHIQESEALGYDHKIPRITLTLSRLLRYAIESTDLVSLETELNFTKMYVSILQERYGNKLNVIYDIGPDTLKARVPKLFIQPIIENAIFHGLAENLDLHNTLTLSCRREEGLCAVSVSDNGAGMSAETLAQLRQALGDASPLKGSIGLKNTVTRMHLLYGEAFSLSIDSIPDKGSTFTLRFPYMQ